MKKIIFLCVGVLFLGLTSMANAVSIDVSSGSGIIYGEVSDEPDIFSFMAFAGDEVTLGVDVTAVWEDGEWNYEDGDFADPGLFLFNSLGEYLTENDDWDDLYESLIEDYLILDTGEYFVGVTSTWWDIYPDTDYNNMYEWDTWFYDDQSIQYDLVVTGVSPVPEPGTLFLLGSGLIGLGLYRKKAQVA